MKPLRFLLYIMLFAAVTSSIATAQSSDAAAALPWRNKKVSRVAASFQSIVGASGTTMIAGSNSADAYSGAFAIQLPFAINLFGTQYPAGHNLYVSVAGFVGFDNAYPSCTWPYVLMPDPNYNHLIMPYWSDLKSVTGASEGVYYRLDADPGTFFHDSTLTIEWNVETMTAPFGSGRFQLQLTQVPATSNGIPILPNIFTAVGFNYDPMSSLARSTAPGSFGAAVGLKDLGQGLGIQQMPAYAGDDDGKYLIPTFPGAGLPLQSITRLPTRIPFGCINCQPTPDWYACNTFPLSSYFHYTVPDSSYRMKPVDVDNLVVIDPPSPVFAAPQSNTPLHTHVHSDGTMSQNNVPYAIRITRGDSIISTSNGTIASLAPSTSALIVTPLQTAEPGEYHVMIFSSVQADVNHSNDTATLTYWVSPSHDAMAVSITAPVLVDLPSAARYLTGTPIPVSAMIANSGTLSSSIVAGYSIRDTADSIVANGFDSLGTSVAAGGVRSHAFDSITISQPGFYYIRVYAHATLDSIASNDTLNSIPSHDWTRHGPDPGARGLRPMPFQVVYPVELAVDYPTYGAHLPRTDDTVHGTTQVMAMFANNGGIGVSSVEAHAVIVDAHDSTVYDHTDTIAAIPATPMSIMHYFPDFTPDVSGGYCITVWVRHDPHDSIAANDTARWCFEVVVDSSGGGEGRGGLSLLEGGGRAIVPPSFRNQYDKQSQSFQRDRTMPYSTSAIATDTYEQTGTRRDGATDTSHSGDRDISDGNRARCFDQ